MEKHKNLKGLYTDSLPENTPNGYYRFALNAVIEDNEGNLVLSSENSNESCVELLDNEIIVGSHNLPDNSIIIFTTDGRIDRISQIINCERNILVEAKFNFSVNIPIKVVSRYRRGCGYVLYWTDPKPRSFSIAKPENFKNAEGDWDIDKFSLIKQPDSLPYFTELKVTENGRLPAGSVAIAIRYLDSDLNPTAWLTVSNPLHIYHSSLNQDINKIYGSLNTTDLSEVSEAIKYGNTNKSIKIEVDNLDTSFLYYQLAFIHYDNTSGNISKVYISDRINITNTLYSYTGDNVLTTIAKEELQLFQNNIESAGTITDYKNLLVIGDIDYGNRNYCELQKFASTIAVDLQVKKVPQNLLVNTSKSPEIDLHGMQFQPGEVYSLSISWVFKDGTESPTFHIPGKSKKSENIIFSSGVDVYPMSVDNENKNQTYPKRDNCDKNYWGIDNMGDILEGKNIRHHRLPLRSEIGVSLIEEDYSSVQSNYTRKVRLNYWGDNLEAGKYDWTDRDGYIHSNNCTIKPDIEIIVDYRINGISFSKLLKINPSVFAYESNNLISCTVSVPEFWDRQNYPRFLADYNSNKGILIEAQLAATDVFELIAIRENGASVTADGSSVSANNLKYRIINELININSEVIKKNQVLNLFGLKFSNIKLPPKEITGGKEVIGYKLYMQKRGEEEKTILDSAILLPLMQSDKGPKYVAHSFLTPEEGDHNKVFKEGVALLSPEEKFLDRKYKDYTLLVEGNYKIEDRKKYLWRYKDVLDGTTYNSSIHEDSEKDEDGWDIKTIIRDAILRFEKKYSKQEITFIEDYHNFDALERDTSIFEDKILYNVSADNRISILKLSESHSFSFSDSLPYVYMKKASEDSYMNFLTEEFIPIDNVIHKEEEITLFAGDSYVSPMRYANMLFYENKIRDRTEDDPSWWEYALAGVAIVVGVVLSVTGVGAIAGGSLVALGIGALVTGAGLLYLSSNLKQHNLVQAYSIDYKEGLKYAVRDVWSYEKFDYNPPDDEIRWVGEVLTDVWFESQINIGLRVRLLKEYQTFLDSPGNIEEGDNSDKSLIYTSTYTSGYWTNDFIRMPSTKAGNYFFHKLLEIDENRDKYYKYRGHPLGEGYFINKDYHILEPIKVNFHLPLEYDCCHNCNEKKRNTFIWSQQSFNEELTDNWRTFLPNNYKEVKGNITNIYTLADSLVVHTDEGIHLFPKRYQERVANDIITLIGSGEYFSYDPSTIHNNPLDKGATKIKTSFVYTKYGVYFISDIDRKIYLLDNSFKLNTISDKGISKELFDRLKFENTFANVNTISNIEGKGIVGAYDNKFDRVLFTKKDYKYNFDKNNGLIYLSDNDIRFIEDYDNKKTVYLNSGYFPVKFNNQGELYSLFNPYSVDTKHYKYENNTNKDIVILIDNVYGDKIRNTIFKRIRDLSFTGRIFFIKETDLASRYLSILSEIENNTLTFDEYDSNGVLLATYTDNSQLIRDFDILVFTHSSASYHADTLIDTGIKDPNDIYNTDLNNYSLSLTNFSLNGQNVALKIFAIAVNPYDLNNYAILIQELIASYYARIVQLQDILNSGLPVTPDNNFNQDLIYSIVQNTIDKINPYIVATKQLGINIYTDMCYDNTYFEDMLSSKLDLIVGSKTLIPISVTTKVTSYDYKWILSEEVGYEKINNSFTLSYNNKSKSWISYHSYLPYHYITINNNLYSAFNNTIYKHNVRGKFRKYYNSTYPFIVEYISSSNKMYTEIWSNINFKTKALNYNDEGYYEEDFITFNKIILYNSRQTTGLKKLIVKESFDKKQYLGSQIKEHSGEILIDKKEKEWRLNSIRDYMIENNVIFLKDISHLQNDYFIDKIINPNILSHNKLWYKRGKLKDKYLGVRLISDNLKENIKLQIVFQSEKSHKSDEY